MIVSSYQRRLALGVNVITLSKSGVFFYIDRTTYDAAVIISNKYEFGALIEQFPNSDNEDRVNHAEWLHENMPTPINMLAAYVLLVNEDLEWDLEDCIKALHVITDTISPYRYLSVPKEIRKDVSFSLGILEEAELTTERAIGDTIDIEIVKSLLNGGISVQHQRGYAEPLTPATSHEMVVGTTGSGKQNASSEPIEGGDHPNNIEWLNGSKLVYNENADLSIDWTTTLIDEDTPEEIVAKHPSWVDAGSGMYVNFETDNTMMFDTPEDEEYMDEIEDIFSGEKEEETNVPASKLEVNGQASEKEQLAAMIL